tara:strand:+ start:237 stop:920 length:684 start_codon:yes stop_codon:yes gene_type:complete
MDFLKDALVVVPAYNEELRIGLTLRELSKIFPHILVVDDASNDNTVLIAKQFTNLIISHIYNLGQGGAIQSGVDFFKISNCYKYLITFDADGQHDPHDAKKLLSVCVQSDYDLVVGSRFLNSKSIKQIPKTKRFFLKLANKIENKITDLDLTDAHVGLRVFNRNFCSNLQLYKYRMAHSTEILLHASRNNLKIKEVSVFIKYKEYGQSIMNSINIILDIVYLLIAKK